MPGKSGFDLLEELTKEQNNKTKNLKISNNLDKSSSEEEIEKVVVMTIDNIGASGMKDMGKVMGIVSKQLAGQADGKTISTFVKKNLG